jgi:hypothetical protein
MAVLAFCGIWIGLLARAAKLKRTGKLVAALSLVLCIAFSSSAVASALQEARARRAIRLPQPGPPVPEASASGEEATP